MSLKNYSFCITTWNLDYLIAYLVEEKCERWELVYMKFLSVPSTPRRKRYIYINVLFLLYILCTCVCMQIFCIKYSLGNNAHISYKLVHLQSIENKTPFWVKKKKTPKLPQPCHFGKRAQSYKVPNMMPGISINIQDMTGAISKNILHLSHNPNLSQTVFCKFYFLSCHCARSGPLQH